MIDNEGEEGADPDAMFADLKKKKKKKSKSLPVKTMTLTLSFDVYSNVLIG